MRRHLLPLSLTVMLALSAGTPTHARAEVTPQVRGQQMNGFVRLTFEWPEPTLFTAKTEDDKLIITFDRKSNPNMGAILKQLSPYVTKADKKADGKTIVLTLNEPHRIRTFISENVSGIDLLDVKGARTIAKAKEPVKELAADMGPKPQLEKKVVAKAEKNIPAEMLIDLSTLEPAAGEEEVQIAQAAPAEVAKVEPEAKEGPVASTPAAVAEQAEKLADDAEKQASTPKQPEPEEPPAQPAEAVAEAKPEIKTEAAAVEEKPEPDKEAIAAELPKGEIKAEPKAEAAAVPQGEITQKEAPKEEPKPAGDDELLAKEGAQEGTALHDAGISMVPMSVDQPETAEEEKAEAEAEAAEFAPVEVGEMEPLTTNKVVVSADPDGATLRFPLKERTAMAIFIRVNTLWVVFDKKMEFDLSHFEDMPQTIISKAVEMQHDHATILRIPISDNIYPEVKQQEGQLDLAVILSAKKPDIEAPLELAISTEPPALPNVFVPALEAGSTIEVTDPDIGDALLITPFYTREQGIMSLRDFVEFSVLPSTQGLAIAKKADNTEVVAVRNGLRISLPKGANLSPHIEGAQPVAKSAAATAVGTLFPDEMWALEKNKNPKIAMRNLIQQSVFASTDGGKNLARLRMAQLFLREGFVVEALGQLNTIQKANPAYYRSAKLASMRGAANFLLYRFNDAARDFGAAELNNNKEVAYWRDMLADLLGSPGKTNDFLGMNDHYISKYPAVFRQRLAIVAADRAIAAKEYNTALKIFDTLSKDEIIAPIQPYVDFLTAKISAENGQETEAMEVWKRLAVDDTNKFVKARATFSMVLWQLDNNILTREQAMDQLERLRLGWHGDGLELQVVQLLGDLYFDKHDYVNAMRVWQIGVTGFQNTGPAIEMARKMEDTFIRLFNEGIADKMSPLEALALYYEYRNYTPAGATGTQMIEKLADRLVGVDLLSTAAQLLEQQMRTQMEKAERSRIGAKLADIYLMNNQPKRAMKALQDSVYGDNPILQRVKRNQLTAKAMMMLGRPQEALSVLGQDESAGAEKLRAMIFWNEKDWPKITESVESMFKKREDPSAPLTSEEGEFVLRLALSYVFQGDQQQVQYMRDYFGPLMATNPYLEAFNFITAPDIKLNTRNFDDLLATLSNTRGFISNYKARMELADSKSMPAGQP